MAPIANSTTSEWALSYVLCAGLHSAILTGGCGCTVTSYCKQEAALRTYG